MVADEHIRARPSARSRLRAPGRRCRAAWALACAAWIAGACAGSPPRSGAPFESAPSEARRDRQIESVQVVLHAELDSAAAGRLREAGALGVLRQSLLDWLEHEDRLSPVDGLRVRVRVEALELRSTPTAWLLAGLAAPDRLSVGVEVADSNGVLARFPASAASTLGGWAWRDPDARLLRLARRLGMRVAQGLQSGL